MFWRKAIRTWASVADKFQIYVEKFQEAGCGLVKAGQILSRAQVHKLMTSTVYLDRLMEAA